MGDPSQPSASIREQLQDPRSRERFGLLLLGLLTLLALQLRWFLDLDGITDVDVLNFGLAAWDFDLGAHQPHPPGYPGYVLLLKLVHLVAPGLDPVGVAKWTCRLISVATAPAAWWACRALLRLTAEGTFPARPAEGTDPAPPALPALWRPLAAAAMAVGHPLLWYAGADGQSHASEALATLLLIGAAARLKPGRRRWGLLGFAAALGLAGSLRPTVALLNGPLLVWLLWGRSWRIWAGAVVAGALGVVLWAIPLVALAGGWARYFRIYDALVGQIFLANYSVLSGGGHGFWLRVLVGLFGVGLGLALLPLLAWARCPASQRGPWRWRALLLATIGVNALFYGLTFVGDLAYFVAVAAVAVLVPATWPGTASVVLRVRAAVVLVGLPLVLLLGPAEIPHLLVKGKMEAPTLARMARYEGLLSRYRADVCRWSGPDGLLILTDNEILTHSRYVAHRCPGTVAAVHLFQPGFRRAKDVWLIFSAWTLRSAPTEVPLEDGPPSTIRLPRPVRYVLLAHGARKSLYDAVVAAARCPPVYGQVGPKRWPDVPLVYEARCLPSLHRGAHRLLITSSVPPSP